MMNNLPIPVGNYQIKRRCLCEAAVMAQRAIACCKLVGVIFETVKECWNKTLFDLKTSRTFLHALDFIVVEYFSQIIAAH